MSYADEVCKRSSETLKEAELMLRVLIAYGTSEGQTGRIAECLANVIRSQGTRRSR